ncbi:trimeric intracellular cation channel family protein [Collinsella intestinalis]|uniref:Trimeric intracellular cation channel family protein n=1 Tax=Collinsella intestinalis TaxID=147207 RepID=A0A414FVA9_9ACTN|nr:TRIC cation channel family protein [Collinsella intestinalis]RHD55067.1 trimeric intracellular cation channel family protein [Collinsella intestinalis]
MFPAVLAVTQSAASASVIASESVAIPLAFELLAVVVAAATGALTARENKLDLVGAIGLAVLVSLGGGLIRDVILQEGNVYILRQPLALPVAVATAAAVFTFPVMVEKPDRLVAILDIFSVGLFAVMGADKTMLYGYPAITCVMMGFFTAVGGGLLRDVCLARVPYIFQRSNLYAIAAIAGALTYIVLVQCLDIWNIAAAVIGVAVTMAVRWWSIRYNIMSPTEVDLHKLPEPVKKVARPVVRPVRKAAQHVSTKTSQAAEQARLRKIERQHKRDRQRETHRHRR